MYGGGRGSVLWCCEPLSFSRIGLTRRVVCFPPWWVLCLLERANRKKSKARFTALSRTPCWLLNAPRACTGRPAREALFHEPCMVACDAQARVYVADSKNDAVRVVIPPLGGDSAAIQSFRKNAHRAHASPLTRF